MTFDKIGPALTRVDAEPIRNPFFPFSHSDPFPPFVIALYSHLIDLSLCLHHVLQNGPTCSGKVSISPFFFAFFPVRLANVRS